MAQAGPTTRRQFFKTLGWLFAAGVAEPLADLLRAARAEPPGNSRPPYRLLPWTGDDFTIGHRLRDGNIPRLPVDCQRNVEFVIAGGGISGLVSAYYLRDHDFLLLEQYDVPGGHATGRSYRGIDYSLGAAYMGTNEGIFGQLFDELGIRPVTLPPTKNSWYWEGKWYPGCSGKDQSILYRELSRFIDECKPVWKAMPACELRLPLTEPHLFRLDSAVFGSGLSGYDERFLSLLDSFLKSSSCAGLNQLSALAGYYLAQDLVSPSYVFKGGNPAITRALLGALGRTGSGRVATGAFVWRIDIRDGGASVVYSLKDGSTHRVNCRRVIVAVPPLVAARIIPDLDDRAKAALLSFKFGAYLVANFCMPRKTFNGAYDNWVGSPFTFSDVILAETPYLATGTYKDEMGSVLTVYQPYANLSPGRTLLLQGNRQAFASSLVDQLSGLVPQFQSNLEEVVLTRWGHAMVIARPGLFARLAQLRAIDTGPVILAHNSMAGLPSAESAISAARLAADRALGRK